MYPLLIWKLYWIAPIILDTFDILTSVRGYYTQRGIIRDLQSGSPELFLMYPYEYNSFTPLHLAMKSSVCHRPVYSKQTDSVEYNICVLNQY
jgi:hypothetical protein